MMESDLSNSNTSKNKNNDVEEAVPEESFLDPDEQEILAAQRREVEEARVAYETQQAQQSAVLAQQNATTAKERSIYCKYGKRFGLVAILIVVIIIVVVAVSGGSPPPPASNPSPAPNPSPFGRFPTTPPSSSSPTSF